MAHFDGNLKKYTTFSQLRTTFDTYTDPILPNNKKYFQRGDLDNYNFYEIYTTSNIYQLYNDVSTQSELLGPFNLRQNTTPKKLLSSNDLIAGRLSSSNGDVYTLYFALTSMSSSGCIVDTQGPHFNITSDGNNGPYIYTGPNYYTDYDTVFISYFAIDIGFRNNSIDTMVKNNFSTSYSYSYSYYSGFTFDSDTNILTWEMDMDKIQNLVFNHTVGGFRISTSNYLLGNILAYGLVNIGLNQSCPQSTLSDSGSRMSWYSSKISLTTLSSKRYIWLHSSSATYAYVKNIYFELTSYDCVNTPILSFDKPIICNKDISFYFKIQKDSSDLLESVYINGTKYTPSSGSSIPSNSIELTHQSSDFYTQCYIMGKYWDSGLLINNFDDPVFIINNIM